MKKIFIISALIFSFGNFVSGQINKSPASSVSIEYKQPDSTIVTITLKGDEHLHWASTEDGYTILANKVNGYEYAKYDKKNNLKRSGKLAHNPGNRTKKEIRFLKKINKGLSFSDEQINKSKEK